MRYLSQPGGFYGTGLGNNAAFPGPGQLSTDVIQANIPNAQLLSQGIPVGQDPRFPMDQKMFEAYVDERRIKNRYPNPGDLLREWREYNQNYTPGGQAGIPAGFDGKYVS